LVRGGWLDESGALTASGRARRQAIEVKTDAHTERLLAAVSDSELDKMVRDLPALVD
jgi:hypothetical protein